MIAAVERALGYAGHSHTLADLHAGIAAGTFQCFEGEESTIITEILDTPRLRILNVFLAAGELRELEAMAIGITAWAKSRGCRKAQFLGRPGFLRTPWPSSAGWKPIGVMMEVDL